LYNSLFQFQTFLQHYSL